jgi:hypothetical protein
MSLREKLDAFRAQVESGRRIPISVVEKLHKSTEELVASGQAERAKKAGDRAPTFELRDIEARGGQLVAISMQTAPNSRRSIEQNKLGFPGSTSTRTFSKTISRSLTTIPRGPCQCRPAMSSGRTA